MPRGYIRGARGLGVAHCVQALCRGLAQMSFQNHPEQPERWTSLSLMLETDTEARGLSDFLKVIGPTLTNGCCV